MFVKTSGTWRKCDDYWSVHVSDQCEIKQIFTVQQKPRNAVNESSMLRVNRHAISRIISVTLIKGAIVVSV